MRVLRLVGSLAIGGLAACAGNNEEAQLESTTPMAAQEPQQPAEIQKVAGQEESAVEPGKLYMTDQGTMTKDTGRYQEQRGEWFAPQGVYGDRGTYGVEGKTAVKGTYGTFFKAEQQIQEPQSLTINKEGSYTQEFGGQPQSGALSERQPVAGRDDNFLMVTRDNGQTLGVRDGAIIKSVQEKLAAAGAYSGPVDGKAGPATGSALLKFQSQHGLPATGSLDRKSAEALGIDWSMLQSQLKQKVVPLK